MTSIRERLTRLEKAVGTGAGRVYGIEDHNADGSLRRTWVASAPAWHWQPIPASDPRPAEVQILMAIGGPCSFADL